MHLQSFTAAAVACLASIASAQTPAGFTPAVSTNLNVTFAGNNVVSPPGELVPRADTLNPPSIRAPAGASNSSRYIIFMIDVDVARNGTRVPLLHWLVPNVAIAANGSLSVPVPTNGSAGGIPGAVYAQPSPPVGDIPHRYTQILFAQPASFVFPASFSYVNPVNPTNATARVGFNITQFIQAAGLSAPLAANYISVQNLTGVTGTATTFPPYNPTSTATSNRNGTSVVPFPGAASQMVSVSWIWSTVAVIGAGIIAAGMIAL